MDTDLKTAEKGWTRVLREPPTRRQKQTLYRLGYGRWIVGKMTTETADTAIKLGLALHEKMRRKE